MSRTTKRNIQFGIFITATLIAFTGCATNKNLNNLSGSYDAETFRENYDPDPSVDYSTIERKRYKKLNVSSGTYAADTFREKYDPDPNVHYAHAPSKAYKTTSNSGKNSNNGMLWGVVLGSIAQGYMNSQISMDMMNAQMSVNSAVSNIRF